MPAAMKYRLGIDVGAHSLGICAIELDDDDHPARLLNCQVVVHDGGVDPTKQKTSDTRLAVSGMARRIRRASRRRRRRLDELDRFIVAQGWPLVDLASSDDPFLPWRVRAELADKPVPPSQLDEKLSIMLRHIARHRGWRSSYTRVESLLAVGEPSDFLQTMRSRAEEILGYELSEDLTSAQIIMKVGPEGGRRLRQNDKKSGLLGGKLHQSDNAREIKKIFARQGLSDDLMAQVIRKVFVTKPPGLKAAERAGLDPLPGQGGTRALRASQAFEKYRVAAALGNVRVEDSGEKRSLDAEEMVKAFHFLTSRKNADVSWSDVAECLGLPPTALSGAAVDLDGERLSARPPAMVTETRILAAKIKTLTDWWKSADDQARDELIKILTHGGELEDSLGDVLAALDEKALQKLDSIHLPPGRAAYSEDSLRRLTSRMLADGCDLHSARKTEFGVADDWQPPAPSVGEPIGNPSTDRVLKETARVITGLRTLYGDPVFVNIEHVREGFSSTFAAKQRDKENQARFRRNEELLERIRQDEQLSSPPRSQDIPRYLAIQRQGCKCAYCGELITFHTAELDHIVPRAGVGSTNTRNNLVAVCRRCNQAKGKKNFALWAEKCDIPGVSLTEAVDRVRMWETDAGISKRSFRKFQQEVIVRLRRTDEDPEIDGRSMESVAWMARELRRRVAFEIPGATVGVYRGELTAEARKAAGIEKVIPFIGGPGKTRFDRRHHAVDAAVIAMMRPAVAKVLAERIELRKEQRFSSGEVSSVWKEYQGKNEKTLYLRWQKDIHKLTGLLTDAFMKDAIPVRENLRLRIADSAAHEATIDSLDKTGKKGAKAPRYRLGDALPVDIIDRAGTPALWCALTRLPDFDAKRGLPVNPDRTIKVNGSRITAEDLLPIGPEKAFILVRGGYASIGTSIHHARIYLIPGKKPRYGMIRVFAEDLRRHQGDDLFNVDLPPQAISVRMADPKVRHAVVDGSAEYLGWIVLKDEIHVNTPADISGDIADFFELLPGTIRWRAVGYEDKERLKLRPVQLASEGLDRLPENSPIRDSKIVRTIVEKGWRTSVNVLFGQYHPVVVRRDALGRVRLKSAAHLPVTWSGDHGPMAGG